MSAHQAGWVFTWCALACLLMPNKAAGQILEPVAATVHPIQDLAFGEMLPGVPGYIAPSDPQGRATFEIRGIGNYNLGFVLPSEMTSPDGDRMPISFGAQDAQLSYGLGLSLLPPETFDPRTQKMILIPAVAGGAQVYLGGLASPATTQKPGDYTATITLVLAPIL